MRKGLGLVGLGLLVGLGSWVSVGRAEAAQSCAVGETMTQTWKGIGSQVTEPFRVDGPWEIQWGFDGPPPTLFQITVKHKFDPLEIGTAVPNQYGNLPSRFFMPEGGDYFLDVMALDASWYACIVPLKFP